MNNEIFEGQPAAEGKKHPLVSLTRRRFLQGSAALAGASGLALGVDGVILEPNHPRVVRIDAPIRRLPHTFDGFTIAQISDFHYDEVFSAVPISAAVEMVNRLNVDLVLLTGDFVTTSVLVDYLHNWKEAANAAEPCARLLAPLRSKLGRIAILGNHDAASDPVRIMNVLASYDIPVLRNRSVPIERNGARFWICGLDSVMEGKPDIHTTLKGVPLDEPKILLVHEPDYADTAAHYPFDFQLSGHSHGGQIWLPVVGAPWLPDFAQKYPRGMHKVGNLTLYTNIGLGTIRLPVRINCTPEVTLITLRSI